jgi:hypothetical protein
MKTVSPVVSRNPVDFRSSEAIDSKFMPINELAHDLCNELTVIKLCKEHLACLLLEAGDVKIIQALGTLERALQKATQLAGRLPQLTAQPLQHSEPKTLPREQPQPLSNDALRLL